MRNCNNVLYSGILFDYFVDPEIPPLQDVTIRAYGDNDCMFDAGSRTKSSASVRETDCLVQYAQCCNFLRFVLSRFCCPYCWHDPDEGTTPMTCGQFLSARTKIESITHKGVASDVVHYDNSSKWTDEWGCRQAVGQEGLVWARYGHYKNVCIKNCCTGDIAQIEAWELQRHTPWTGKFDNVVS